MSTEIDVPEEATPAEERAFNNASAGDELFGFALAPYSPVRERAAQAMGMRMPMWKPEDFEAMATGNVYAGGLRDVFIYLWLCSIPTASEAEEKAMAERKKAKVENRKPNVSLTEWTVQRAERNPEQAYEVAAEFCESHGILIGSNKFMAAYPLVVQKGQDILASRFTISNPGTGDEEKKEGNV